MAPKKKSTFKSAERIESDDEDNAPQTSDHEDASQTVDHEDAPRAREKRPAEVSSPRKGAGSKKPKLTLSAKARGKRPMTEGEEPRTKRAKEHAQMLNKLAGIHIEPVPNTEDTGIERFNIENLGFPPRKIAVRNAGIHPITFAVKHFNDGRPGRIYFYHSDELTGGPYACFSNFYTTTDLYFPYLAWSIAFPSLEAAYQMLKAWFMRDLGEERRSQAYMTTIEGEFAPISSKDVYDEIRMMCRDNRFTANHIADLGRSFCYYKDSQDPADRDWYESWAKDWEFSIEEAMEDMLREKFSSSWELRVLLMMTGSYEFYEASPSDINCGIGISAQEAYFKDPAKYRGKNVLGKLTAKIREEIRAAEPAWPSDFAIGYWSEEEDSCHFRHAKKLSVEEVQTRKEKAKIAREAWLAKGGAEIQEYKEKLEARIAERRDRHFKAKKRADAEEQRQLDAAAKWKAEGRLIVVRGKIPDGYIPLREKFRNTKKIEKVT